MHCHLFSLHFVNILLGDGGSDSQGGTLSNITSYTTVLLMCIGGSGGGSSGAAIGGAVAAIVIVVIIIVIFIVAFVVYRRRKGTKYSHAPTRYAVFYHLSLRKLVCLIGKLTLAILPGMIQYLLLLHRAMELLTHLVPQLQQDLHQFQLEVTILLLQLLL